MSTAYIVAKLAQPGDVLLTVGPKWPIRHSWPIWLIRAFTWSYYSHASIMMTRLGRLETNGPGLTSQLTVGRTLCDDHGRLLIDTGAKRAVLLRPTQQAIASSGYENQLEFSLKVMKSLFAYLGREYAEPADLRYAAKFPFWLLLSAIKHLPVWRSEENPSFLRRWFCSSLVAQVYSDANLTIDTKGYERISPGDLRSSKQLKVVQEAVVYCAPEKLNWRCNASFREVTIHGTLRSDELRDVFEYVANQARQIGLNLAAENLEAELDRRLREPASAVQILLRRERALRKSGLL